MEDINSIFKSPKKIIYMEIFWKANNISIILEKKTKSHKVGKNNRYKVHSNLFIPSKLSKKIVFILPYI